MFIFTHEDADYYIKIAAYSEGSAVLTDNGELSPSRHFKIPPFDFDFALRLSHRPPSRHWINGIKSGLHALK